LDLMSLQELCQILGYTNLTPFSVSNTIVTGGHA
jgi:hypothetical protein